jgi:hypothetical protein
MFVRDDRLRHPQRFLSSSSRWLCRGVNFSLDRAGTRILTKQGKETRVKEPYVY